MPQPSTLRRAASALALLFVAGCAGSGGGRGDAVPPTATYRVYVGAESADLLHRVRFGPDGATVESTTAVGEMAVENEGPHGFAVAPDGRFVYMTTGHGVPDGKLWKFEAGPDTLVAAPILLGYFPATLDLTPDGLYAFVVNFNLHGEMVPSTVSVVYTPDMIEVKQIETCTMPHGMRVAPDGLYAYSACMMDDQLVELDTRTFEVSRRFGVGTGAEGPLAPDAVAAMGGMDHGSRGGAAHAPTCSPTWAEPSVDGRFVYVACNRSDVIHEVDRQAWRVTRTFQAGRAPYNLEATPDGRLLVATLKSGAAVEFFDLATGESLAITPSSTTVTHGVVVSPDSRYAFVSVEGVGAEPGKVDVFDLRTFRRLADVAVGQQAGGIAFWRMEGP
ncbi:MAG: YncE family protein [Gemmatimonadetes bacterium]|nr:YncE family protein [Gemmatimonadota bacterium]